MAIIGIICEYNPFHRGHAYQIQRLKEEGHLVVCLMSSYFVQRGQAAVTRPEVRAVTAVKYGADLVLSLPVSASLSSAEGFAKQGVQFALQLGLEGLSFGLEGDFESLCKMDDLLMTQALQEQVAGHIREGLPYKQAIESALSDQLSQKDLISFLEPNNTLARLYGRYAKKLHPNFQLLPLKRVGSSYEEEEITSDYPSATALRKRWKEGLSLSPYVDPFLEEKMNETGPEIHGLRELYCMLYRESFDFSKLPDYEPGMENLLFQVLRDHSYEEGLRLAVNKRYSASRLRRFLINALLRREEVQDNAKPFPIIPLAYQTSALPLLAGWREKDPIYHKKKLDVDSLDETLDLERRALELYGLIKGLPFSSLYTDKAQYIDE